MASVLLMVAFAAALGVGAWLLAGNVVPVWLARRKVVGNLRRGWNDFDEPVDVVGTAGDQAEASGLIAKLAALASRIMPKPVQNNLAKMYDKAGRPSDYSLEKMLALHLVGLGVGVMALFSVPNLTPGPMGLVGGVVAFVLGLAAPELLLYSKSMERKTKILNELPDLLDQMVIAVSAGIAFEGAMDHASRSSEGPLADEMRRAIQAIQIGLPRQDAYAAMAKRCGVPEVNRFTRAVNQAIEHGMPLSDVLNQQATLMRMQRRQRAEAKAAMIPVKVVFPTLLFFMPVLIIIIMAPPLLKIAYEVFHWF